MKPYRLLRNNKETGPYSAEELITMGLKAYDLVWVDGKSAAWRYPCEIAELKPYAPEAEDLAATLWKPLPSKENKADNSSPVASPSETPVPKPRIRVRADWRKVEENKNVSNNTPSEANRLAERPVTNTPAPEKAANKPVETGSPELQSDVKRQEASVKQPEAGTTRKPSAGTRKPESFVRVNSGTDGRLKEEKAEPQIKYSESLEDIKQRYNETVLQRKRPVLSSRHGWLLLLVPALCIGMWIGSGWTRDKQPQVAKQPVAETTPQEQPQAASLQSVMADEADAQAEGGTASDAATSHESVTEAATSGETVPGTTMRHAAGHPAAIAATHGTTGASGATGSQPAGGVKATQPVGAPATGNAQAVGTTVAKSGTSTAGTAGTQPGKAAHATIGGLPAQGVKEVAVNNQGKVTPASAQAAPGKTAQSAAQPAAGQPVSGQAAVAKDNTGAKEQDSDAPTVKQASKTSPAVSLSKKQISDYVSVEEELKQLSSGKEMKLHVKNITDMPVDLVVLDLQYYDSNGKFKKGETLYVNHLSANDAVALRAPTVKNAQRIDYKVSLLSIEKNGVYLIAE